MKHLRHCITYQQNEEKRRHCNANWKPTSENNAKLQIYDLIMTSNSVNKLIEKFPSVYRFRNGDLNKFVLLLRKSVYPY